MRAWPAAAGWGAAAPAGAGVDAPAAADAALAAPPGAASAAPAAPAAGGAGAAAAAGAAAGAGPTSPAPAAGTAGAAGAAGVGVPWRNTEARQVGQFCCLSSHDLRQCRWNTWPQCSFLLLPAPTISSRQMMHTPSARSRSAGVASGRRSRRVVTCGSARSRQKLAACTVSRHAVWQHTEQHSTEQQCGLPSLLSCPKCILAPRA